MLMNEDLKNELEDYEFFEEDYVYVQNVLDYDFNLILNKDDHRYYERDGLIRVGKSDDIVRSIAFYCFHKEKNLGHESVKETLSLIDALIYSYGQHYFNSDVFIGELEEGSIKIADGMSLKECGEEKFDEYVSIYNLRIPDELRSFFDFKNFALDSDIICDVFRTKYGHNVFIYE